MSEGDFLTLSQAAKLLPARPHATAVWRWARCGLLGRNGERVFLRHVRLGRTLYTKVAWIEAFGKGVAAADACHFAAPTPVYRVPRGRRSPEEVREAVDCANAELALDGI